jgi:uncharacterized membrane protein YqjE
VLAGLAALHLLVAGVAWLRLRALRAARPPPFAQTLAELERDRQWLARHFRSDH